MVCNKFKYSYDHFGECKYASYCFTVCKIFLHFYRPQTKFAKVMFLHLSVSHSVHRGSTWAGTPLARYTPPKAGIPPTSSPPRQVPMAGTPSRYIPQKVHPLGRYPRADMPPAGTPPVGTPPRQVHPLVGTPPGQVPPLGRYTPPPGRYILGAVHAGGYGRQAPLSLVTSQ